MLQTALNPVWLKCLKLLLFFIFDGKNGVKKKLTDLDFHAADFWANHPEIIHVVEILDWESRVSLDVENDKLVNWHNRSESE